MVPICSATLTRPHSLAWTILDLETNWFTMHLAVVEVHQYTICLIQLLQNSCDQKEKSACKTQLSEYNHPNEYKLRCRHRDSISPPQQSSIMTARREIFGIQKREHEPKPKPKPKPQPTDPRTRYYEALLLSRWLTLQQITAHKLHADWASCVPCLRKPLNPCACSGKDG